MVQEFSRVPCLSTADTLEGVPRGGFEENDVIDGCATTVMAMVAPNDCVIVVSLMGE